MITIDYDNAKLVDICNENGASRWCWIDAKTGAILREYAPCDLALEADDEDGLALEADDDFSFDF